MDIRGISEKSVAQLYEKLDVRSVTDLYYLKADDVARLDGYKDKKIENFISSVEKSKSVPLDRFINALGIENVGKKTARDLALRFKSMHALMDAERETLLEIEDIGEVVADSITSYFGKHRALIEKFREIGIDPKIEQQTANGAFSGKKFVLTGTLPTYTRSEATKLIENAGGEVASSVSKDTDYVLAGDNAGSKLEKARQKGIKIISEKEFISLLNS